MTQGSDQQAGAGAGADTPAAQGGAGAVAGAMTLGSILTVAGILLLFVFFACGLLSLQYCFNAFDSERHQLQGDRPRRRRPPGGDGGGRGARATRGVDPDLLRSLPVTVYRAAPAGSGKGGDDAVECAVCLAELEDGEEARFLPRCGHGFHAGCVDTWLASHTTCPLCRLTVAKPDALPLVPPEPANYAAANLPASVLLGVSDQQGAVAMATAADGAPSPSTAASPVLVIEIPELAAPTTTQLDTLKSPGSARLRSIRRLLSFGRQGAAAAGPSSSCSCAGEEADLELGQH